MTTHASRVPLALAAAVVSVIALAACAPQAQETPTPTAAATSSPSPTATTTPEVPAVAFDGDCEDVVSSESVSAAMGEAMAFWEPQWVDGADAELGGVRCGWVSGEYLSGFTTIWVYPESVLDAGYVGGDASNSCATEESSCIVSAVFDGTWVGVQAYSSNASTQIENLRPVLDDIGARVTESGVPTPGPREGWWLPVVGCAELATALTDGGVPATAVDDRPSAGPVFVNGPRNRGCTIDLTIDGTQRVATLHLDAGAGAGLDSVLSLDPSQRVGYEGHTFARAGEQYPIDGNPGLLLGSDGVNLVSLLRGDVDGGPEVDAPILAAVLAALGS